MRNYTPDPEPETPTNTADANAKKAALEVYTKFTDALNQAQINPQRITPRPEQDIRPYTFNPAQADLNRQLFLGYAYPGITMGGTPPTSRPKITVVNLKEKPYPSVFLEDCPLPSSEWKAYHMDTGEAVKAKKSLVPEPHPIEVQLIFNQNRWGVARFDVKDKQTCTR